MNYRRLAALGSSFAAGPGIEPIVDRAASRSGRNYAHLLAERLGAELTDLTVSGATTATILDHPQRVRPWRSVPPQLDGLPTDADLVTLTAGGNDLGYIGGMMKAALTGRLDDHRPTAPLARLLRRNPLQPVTDQQVEAAADGLVRIVEETRRRAPKARVILVDYLTVLGPETHRTAQVPFTDSEIATLRKTGERVIEAFATAAGRTGADLVEVSVPSRDHALGSADPWMNGFHLSMRPTPFHPNAAGMRAVADAIVEHLERSTPSGT